MLNVDMEYEIGVRFWVRQGYVPYATRMKCHLPSKPSDVLASF